MSNLLKKEKGFTLIEIVLVLAIAGLLLVIVFLAVSGAQKSRRDSQRKNDLSRLATQIESYASNTNGVYPVADLTAAAFAAYVPANFTDPTTGATYTLPTVAADAPAAASAAGTITYEFGAGTTCDAAANTNARIYTVRMKLEQGIACRDNK